MIYHAIFDDIYRYFKKMTVFFSFPPFYTSQVKLPTLDTPIPDILSIIPVFMLSGTTLVQLMVPISMPLFLLKIMSICITAKVFSLKTAFLLATLIFTSYMP